MYKILISFGTRPEAIKMSPLIIELKKREDCQIIVCSTGQHKEMLQQVLDIFDIKPDINLAVMQKQQTLPETFSTILNDFEKILKDKAPDLVLIHGDTLTTAACAMACYFSKIKFGHVEAGLRSNNLYSPWPEEGNRRLASVFADYHFAVTDQNRMNLLKENIPAYKIFVCGNTVIDALIKTRQKLKEKQLSVSKNMRNILKLYESKNIILVTVHRRENFGEGLANICAALSDIAKENSDVQIVIPVHLNPTVQKVIYETLGGLSNILLIDPLTYVDFIELMEHSSIILTDSGGIQEEAPSLRKPVLVLRDTTERWEAVEAGTVKLIGTSKEKIISEVNKLLHNTAYRDSFVESDNPYGDGKAAQRIINIITSWIKEN